MVPLPPVNWEISSKKKDKVFGKIEIINGVGKFYDSQKKEIETNEFIFHEKLKGLHYVPSKIGKHIIKFVCRNFDGNVIEKTIDIEVNNFLVTTKFISKGFVNAKIPIDINIKNISLSHLKYIKYFLLKGRGSLLDKLESEINFSKAEKIPSLNFRLYYKPFTDSDHKIKIMVCDKQDNIVTKEINIVAFSKKYEVKSSFEQENIYINEGKLIVFSISDNLYSKSYFSSFQFLEGQEFVKVFSSDKKTELFPNAYIKHKENDKRILYYFKAVKKGVSRILFSFKNVNGEKVTKAIHLGLHSKNNKIAFDFTIQTPDFIIYKDEKRSVKFKINQKTPGNTKYQIQYKFIKGTGILKDTSGKEILVNTFQNIGKGANAFSFIGSTIGTHIIHISVKNANQIVTKEIKITVNKTDFTSFVTSNVKSKFLGGLIPFDLTIRKLGIENIRYFARLTSDKQGKFIYGGNTYNSNAIILFPDAGTFPIQYMGKEKGVHTLQVEITASNGVTKPLLTTDLTFNEIDFKFTIQKSQYNIYKDEVTGIAFKIEQTNFLNAKPNYQIKYELTGAGGTLKDASGNKITVNAFQGIGTGDHTFNFTGSKVETHRIKFTVKNDTGVEKSKNLTMKVNRTDFRITGNPQLIDTKVNERVTLNLGIKKLGIENGITYTLYAKYNAKGTITINRKNINLPNNDYALIKGGLSEGNIPPLSFVPTQEISGGSLKFKVVAFKEKKELLKKELSGINVNAITVPFTLTINPAKTTLYQGEEINNTITIKESDKSKTSTNYKITFRSSDKSAYSLGWKKTEDTEYGVSLNSQKWEENWKFKAKAFNKKDQKSRTVTVTYKVTNNTGQEETAKKTYTIKPNKFKVTNIKLNPPITSSNNLHLINLLKDRKQTISFDLSETGTNLNNRDYKIEAKITGVNNGITAVTGLGAISGISLNNQYQIIANIKNKTSYKVDFVAKKACQNKYLHLRITDDFSGDEKEITYQLKIAEVKFTPTLVLNLKNPNQKVYYGQRILLKLHIKNESKYLGNKTLQFKIKNIENIGEGKLTYNNKEVSGLTFTSSSPGEYHELYYTPLKEKNGKTSDLELEIEETGIGSKIKRNAVLYDSNGSKVTINQNKFEFRIDKTDGDKAINVPGKCTFIITEKAGTGSGLMYTLNVNVTKKDDNGNYKSYSSDTYTSKYPSFSPLKFIWGGEYRITATVTNKSGLASPPVYKYMTVGKEHFSLNLLYVPPPQVIHVNGGILLKSPGSKIVINEKIPGTIYTSRVIHTSSMVRIYPYGSEGIFNKEIRLDEIFYKNKRGPISIEVTGRTADGRSTTRKVNIL